MHHDLKTYFADQLNRTAPATQETINNMLAWRRDALWSKFTPEQIALDANYLQSKVGQSTLYYMQVDAVQEGTANHTMHIGKVWSDELEKLDQDLHDYYYDPLGETDFPRFVHRTHKI